MARGTWVMRDGKLVPKHLAPPLTPRGARSSLPCPQYISDSLPGGLDGLINMSDGKRYTSKAAFRAENRARGLTEIGNESWPEPRMPTQAEVKAEIASDVARAYDALESGCAEYRPATPNADADRGTLVIEDYAAHAAD